MDSNSVLDRSVPGWLHVDLDGAWDGLVDLPRFDARAWGPRLRSTAPPAEVEAFAAALPALPPYVLLGSGDFHHLTRLLLRGRGAETVVAFDNHPDWDVRPPRWGCGGWAARAARTHRVVVWGCGSFEPRPPHRLFGSGRVEIRPWRERQPESVCRRHACVSRERWREEFERFAAALDGPVYVTVDLDCLRAEDAATNWESGLFTDEDVAWAIGKLGSRVAGDVCGAWSQPAYARIRQRVAGRWDHPRVQPPDAAARERTAASLRTILAAF